MAEYNFINSKVANELVEGTESNDSINVYGNHSTVQANGGNDIISVNGGRHDSGIWLDGDETNVIYAGDGNDSINVQSRGASIYGEGGNDTININRGHTFADGGDGEDLFYFNAYYYGYDLTDITITGGTGKDTVRIDPYYSRPTKVVVTDFSNDDVLRIDNYGSYTGSSRRVINQSVQNGNVVISDNSSLNSYGGNITKTNVDPMFSITLQGVGDISEVADAKYYRYSGTSPQEYKTFAELFGVSVTTNSPVADTLAPATGTSETVTTTTTTETTTTVADTTTTSESATTASGVGDTIINNYYGDYYDNSNNNGTIINNSSIGGDVTNNTSVDNSVTIIKEGDTYTYSGGDKVITNYQQGEVVELASDYAGIDLNGNSFYVKSSSGQLELQNVRNKFVGYSANSEVVAYSYVASNGGTVDGRGYNKAEIMIGADNADNQIYAGGSGSSLWGGVGGNDTLTGSSGYNEFFYAVGGGSDVVQSYNSTDLINLASVNLSQISNVDVNIGQVNINFVDGGNLQVNGDSNVRYQVAEGTFSVNQYTKQWTNR